MDMTFKTFFLGLAAAERKEYAGRAGSTEGYLLQVAYGNKLVELGMADALVAASGGVLKLEMLPLTDRAKQQDSIRRADHDPLPVKDDATKQPAAAA